MTESPKAWAMRAAIGMACSARAEPSNGTRIRLYMIILLLLLGILYQGDQATHLITCLTRIHQVRKDMASACFLILVVLIDKSILCRRLLNHLYLVKDNPVIS